MNYQPSLRIPTSFALGIVTMCWGAGIAGAQRAESVPLASIPAKVRAQNPSLAAARLRIEEARGRLTGAGRLSNPEFETGFSGNPDTSESAFEIGLVQRFPVTARLRLEKKVSEAEVRVAEEEVREVERKLIFEAQEAAIRAVAVRDQKALRQRQAKLAEELAEYIRKAVEAGEDRVLDAGQARLEAGQIVLELRAMEKVEIKAHGALKALLGMEANSPVVVTGVLPAVAVPLRGADPSARPDYRAAVAAIHAAAHEVELEKAKRVGDVSVGLHAEAAREEDAPEGLENEQIIGFKFSIPLPFWNRNEGRIQETSAKKERLEKEASALADGIMHQAMTARLEMGAQKKIIDTIRNDLLPLAEAQVVRADAAYKEGGTDLQPLLRARDQQLKLESAHLDALRDFHLARVRWEAATGKHSAKQP